MRSDWSGGDGLVYGMKGGISEWKSSRAISFWRVYVRNPDGRFSRGGKDSYLLLAGYESLLGPDAAILASSHRRASSPGPSKQPGGPDSDVRPRAVRVWHGTSLRRLVERGPRLSRPRPKWLHRSSMRLRWAISHGAV
jgi:hypothetical protein